MQNRVATSSPKRKQAPFGQQKLRINLLLWSLLLTLLLSAIYLTNPATIKVLTLKSTDIIIDWASKEATEPAIELVAIDDESLKKYGQWPWPRYRIAKLLKKIELAGARSIGINIIFPEQDRTSPILWQKNLQQDFGYSMDTGGLPPELLDHDTYLAKVLSQGPYIMGYEFLFNDKIPFSEDCLLNSISLSHKMSTSIQSTPLPFHRANEVICNYNVLSKNVNHSGFLNGSPDIDGVFRRIPLLIDWHGNLYPSFSLAILMDYFGNDLLTLKRDSMQTDYLSIGDIELPTDSNGNFLLGPVTTKNRKAASTIDILEDKAEMSIFKDSIVLVGLTATGLSQQFLTPLGEANTLLDLHRYSIKSMVNQLRTIRTTIFPFYEAGITLFISLLLVLAIGSLTTPWATITWIFTLALIWIGAGIVYQTGGYLFSPLLPSVSIILSFCLLLIIKYYYYQKHAKAETGTALQLLQTTETNHQSILNSIPDIVFRLDNNGNITFISPAIKKYVENDDLLIGKSIYQLVAPEDLSKSKYKLNERRTGERATFDLEVRLLLKTDGMHPSASPQFFSISTEGMYVTEESSTKTFIGTQGIARDTTKRKLLENQLVRAQKMEVVGNLAAGIAHDLNNILSGLVSYPDILLLEIPKDDPLHNKISIIQKSGQKAAVIVQDLLTLARRSLLIEDICNLNDIIMDYIDSAEFTSIKNKYSKVRIHPSMHNQLKNIKGSPVHLSKAIMNILINAVEAMPAGGDIHVRTSNAHVDSVLYLYEEIPKGKYALTTITDNGVGISEQDLKRIFEPFYTKKSMHTSGTGLGMTIIWATVKDHNGFIDVESSEGVGTTFKIYLPITLEEEASLPSKTVINDYIGTETVLIVDDVPEQLEIGSKMLEKLGYTVLVADNGRKAVEILSNRAVDLLVLDMIMPGGLDGLDTYREVIKLHTHQKAIITSGFSESERVKTLQKICAGGYVQKPYSMESLGMAIRRELDK